MQEIIKKNDFDMGQWKLVESSEQAMLAEVSRAVKKQKFVTFLGWTPHPMNVQLKMHYLKGGEKYFGDTGSVHTLTRKGYAQACPNVGKLLTNLSFTQEMENSIMAEVVNKKVSNADAAKAWIKANPAVLDKWLDGVKTVDGKDALPAVKAKLDRVILTLWRVRILLPRPLSATGGSDLRVVRLVRLVSREREQRHPSPQ